MPKYDFKDGVVTFREGTIIIDSYSFEDIEEAQIKAIVLPEGVRGIEREACYSFKNLVSVEIPKSVQFIGEDAFYGCKLDKATLKRVDEVRKKQIVDKDTTFQFVDYTDYYDDSWIEEDLFDGDEFNEDCDTENLEEDLLSLISKVEDEDIEPDEEVEGIDLGRPGLYIQNVEEQLYAFVWKGIIVIRYE